MIGPTLYTPPSGAGSGGSALDSEVVHKTGTETVSGDKDFTGALTKNGVAVPGIYMQASEPTGAPNGTLWLDTDDASDWDAGFALADDVDAGLATKQPLDADLTTIAAIDSTQAGGVIGTIGAGWVYRTWAQVKTLLGLSNVDNTSDLAKPVSTAQQTALDAKADLVGGTIPSVQLPSYLMRRTLLRCQVLAQQRRSTSPSTTTRPIAGRDLHTSRSAHRWRSEKHLAPHTAATAVKPPTTTHN
jgi:Lower baseplate protein N-terminal domain